MSQIISITKPGSSTVVKTWDSADSAKKEIFVYNNGADILYSGHRAESFIIQGKDNNPTIAVLFDQLDDNYTTADAEAFVDYLVLNGFFLKASGGNGAGTFTGTVIPVNDLRIMYNTATVNSAATYTLGDGTPTLGNCIKIWVNTTTNVTVTGAVKTGGEDWVTGMDFDLILEVEDGRVIYFLVKR